MAMPCPSPLARMVIRARCGCGPTGTSSPITGYILIPRPRIARDDPSAGERSGFLIRRPVRATGIRYVGKETARRIEEESGMLRLSDDAFTEYRDEAEEFEVLRAVLIRCRDEGIITIADLVRESGKSERTVQYWLNPPFTTPRSGDVRRRLQPIVDWCRDRLQ